MRNYTSYEQSKRLVELGLDKDTADMCYIMHATSDNDQWRYDDDDMPPMVLLGNYSDVLAEAHPCWSVGQLMGIIPFECNLHKFTTEGGTVYRLESFYLNHTKSHQYPIDACMEMVEWTLTHKEEYEPKKEFEEL